MPRNYKSDLFKKRQYEWLAETIRNLRLDKADEATSWRAEIRQEIAEEFANALRGSNPRFDRQRFLEACKVKGE